MVAKVLVNYQFGGIKSFRHINELSLEAARADKTLRSAVIEAELSTGKPTALLPVAAIYGANAAGKTNVIVGLNYMQDAVLFSQSSWNPDAGTDLPHTAPAPTQSEPALFAVDLVLEGTRYSYGFAAGVDYFYEEWLSYYPLGRERVLFKRLTEEGPGGEPLTTVELGDSLTGDMRYLRSIISRVRPNSLFLSAAAQDNQAEAGRVFKWFQDKLMICPIGANIEDFEHARTSRMAANHDDFRRLLTELLQKADPSISRIIIDETKSDDSSRFERMVSDPELLRIVKDRFRYNVSFDVSDESSSINIPFASESRGTKKLYGLAGYLLYSLKNGNSLIVDELEASMHPHLARFIVELFQSKDFNRNNAQLVFTTHSQMLLSRSVLRRDQIWIVEKTGLESHLFSLRTFRPRNDEDIERGYLRGRYGGVPSLGVSADWLATLHEG